jgi:hypothetical protein
MRYMLYMCVLRYRVGAYGDGNRLSPNRLDSQVHAHMSRNLRAIEQLAIEVIFYRRRLNGCPKKLFGCPSFFSVPPKV